MGDESPQPPLPSNHKAGRKAILAAVRPNSPATFGTLLEQTGLARSTLAKHLKDLCRNSELTKEESREDARIVYYSLSSKGENSYLKEDTISGLQATDTGAVKQLSFAKVLPLPLIASFLAETKDSAPFATSQARMGNMISVGLARSASATVLSKREFLPASIGQSGIAGAYLSVLGSLMEEKMKEY